MLQDRLLQVQSRIREAATSCGRNPSSVRLVAVSKTQPVSKIREAFDAGATLFGENYIQEARDKIESLSDTDTTWHFIGHLQSNKAKYAVRLFDMIHTVDSVKLAREIDKQAKKAGKIQKILIQVNIGDEQTKSGIQKEDCMEMMDDIRGLKNLSVRGLMTIPPYFDNPERVRPFFRQLRHLRDEVAAAHPAHRELTELSMGMTGDFEAAIEEGATLVRIGTAIFGERP